MAMARQDAIRVVVMRILAGLAGSGSGPAWAGSPVILEAHFFPQDNTMNIIGRNLAPFGGGAG